MNMFARRCAARARDERAQVRENTIFFSLNLPVAAARERTLQCALSPQLHVATRTQAYSLVSFLLNLLLFFFFCAAVIS